MSRAEDVAAIRHLERSWCEAWNSHNMQALTDLLTEDADFVTVDGTWLRGRKEFKEHHALYHATSFKHSIFTVTGTRIKFIHPDSALAHVKWRITGDFDPDGTPRKGRSGIFTQVLIKSQRSGWRILASQNANMGNMSSKKVRSLLLQRDWK